MEAASEDLSGGANFGTMSFKTGAPKKNAAVVTIAPKTSKLSVPPNR